MLTKAQAYAFYFYELVPFNAELVLKHIFPSETKASAPPVYDFYQHPYNQDTLYSNMNGHAGNPVSSIHLLIM